MFGGARGVNMSDRRLSSEGGHPMDRRRFLKLGAAAGTAATLSPAAAWAETEDAPRNRFDLRIEPVDYEMIDGTMVYMLFFFEGEDRAHPTLRALEGEVIEIRVTNADSVAHGFAITGIPAATIPSIPPREARTVTFTAPFGGSYIYLDPVDAPVNRLVGLYGAFLVNPRIGTTLAGSPTPFSRSQHTPAVIALYDALGRIDRFRGNQWDPRDPERDKVWLISEVDPVLNARVMRRETIDPASVRMTFLPRYFHIDFVSGFDAADHAELPPEKRAAAKLIEPEGREGQPTILRCMNAGLCTHSLHIHGNSVLGSSNSDANGNPFCESNILELDAWTMAPLVRRDMLLPFERPADAAVWPPRQEPFPMRYVMHCHTEMSNTAGGGNYPQGIVTHWEMTEPLP
jgi:hypothetical protein